MRHGGPMTRRIALVGLSWISADLAGDAADPTLGTAIPYSHASAIAAIPELELVAGCDISESARDRVPRSLVGALAGPARSMTTTARCSRPSGPELVGAS